MQFIIFSILKFIIECLSRLPMRVLYLFSDILSFFLHSIFKYRKDIIFNNIKTSFPLKNNKELKLIERKFYTHFTDLIFESIKSFTISEKEIKKRYVYKNIEIINDLAKKGKNIALTGSHHNNWELSFGLPIQANINCFGAYTRIKNPYFEKYIKKSRMRFGYDGEITYNFKKEIDNRMQQNIQSLYILLSDQSPEMNRTKYWAYFFEQRVPVHTGAEILAKKYNMAVVNMIVTKIKRGYYEAKFELITESPNNFEDYNITDTYLKITEQQIKKQPENYLWSHKRFKHVERYEEWLRDYKEK